MSQSSHKPTQTLFAQLQNQDWFCQLQGGLKYRQQLQAAFDQHCPLELVGQCTVLGIKGHYLHVTVANASCATQLQFRAREIVQALKAIDLCQPLKRLRVQVSRVSTPSISVEKESRQSILSDKSQQMFMRLAEQVDNEQLKAALLNWAQPR